MENQSVESGFEKEASKAYERFSPIARRYHFSFRRPLVTCGEKPCMVFLGNHSSGKSSLINWILGESVQDTGLAPTDDGFTFIVYGEERDDYQGHAALERLPAEFAGLKAFGDVFVHGLRVKYRPIEILKTVTFVDSPGMIDSAEETVGRDYNFEGVVRTLVELCDMVFYLFDPDKPGTTGETVNIFAKCLLGVKYKLRILLNKCDGFRSMYDFARTYGTLCWNLASVLETKDMPKIWTVYSGGVRENANSTLDFSDFNRHREEFLADINNAAARRRDNIISQASFDFCGLSIRMRILNYAWRRALARRVTSFVLVPALAVLASWVIYNWNVVGRYSAATGIAVGVIVLVVGFGIARLFNYLARLWLAENIDSVFRREYCRVIGIGTHDDLIKTWEEIRGETKKIIRSMPLRLPLFGEFLRWRLEKVRKHLDAVGRQ